MCQSNRFGGPRLLLCLGGLGMLVLAPLLVVVKYRTGWAIIPEPGWVAPLDRSLPEWWQAASPPLLWRWCGTAYALFLGLTVAGWWRVRPRFTPLGRWSRLGHVLLVVGLLLVLGGDLVHSWTWARSGITTPTPGTDPLPNTAYAVHMMGMNLVMVGTMLLGIRLLRVGRGARALGWAHCAVFPAAAIISSTVVPTTPSGGLGWFAVVGVMLGGGVFDRE